MRRKDREITEIDRIEEIIGNSEVLRLGLFDEGYPYIVPLHYGYELKDGSLIFYMHCAMEGHKLDLIEADSSSCVEIDNSVETVSGGEIPCKYGAKFASVIARGKVEVVADTAEKIHGLKLLMKHQTGRDFLIDEAMASTVAVLRFTSSEFTAKARG